MGRLEQLIRRASLNRGAIAEAHARDALDLMQEGGLIITHWPANWKEDHWEHFDEHIVRPDGIEALVDFCSSRGEPVPGVLRLIVKPGETPEEIIPNIIALLGLTPQS